MAEPLTPPAQDAAPAAEPASRTDQPNWKQVAAWAAYDWANSAYATTVLAGFFPIFLREYLAPPGATGTEVTFRLGFANSTAYVLVALMAPVLGAIADRGSAKKRFLLGFALLGVVATGSLPLIARGHWDLGLALYILSVIGFAGGNIFYDSLLITVAGGKRLDFVSALGFACGYLGGGLIFAFNVALVVHPERFGLSDAFESIRRSFWVASLWWTLFALPLLLLVKEPRGPDGPLGGRGAIGAGLRQLRQTFAEIRRLRTVFLFLIGYWLYIDGVDTVILMAIDYGKSLGFETRHLITALLITQFVGFPAAIAFGKLGERLGPRTGIFIGLGVYVGVTFWGFFMTHPGEFYVLAIVVGLVQGGVQALSRSFYARLIPHDRAGQFFGFYNMLGKFAAVLGPALMGVVARLTGNPRYSILAVVILFIGGAAFLSQVREESVSQ